MAQLLRSFPDTEQRARRLRGDDGVAMVIAVIITAIVFTLGSVWMIFAEHASNAARYERHREQAIDAAYAGLARAAATLSEGGSYQGEPLTPFPGGAAMFEVVVTADEGGFRRTITSTGYAPSPDAVGRVQRSLQQVIDLDPVGFQYALMSESSISTGSASAIVGDLYAEGNVTLGNSQDYVGNLHIQGNLTTGSNQTITGTIHANGNVDVSNSSTTVRGSVYALGDIKTGGVIEDDAIAGGAITGSGCGKVFGACSPSTPPALVPKQRLPVFTWDPSNYPTGTVHTYSGVNGGDQLVDDLTKRNSSGVYYVDGDVEFDDNDTLYLVGDLTIVATGSITLPRQVENHTSGGTTVQLSVISTGAPADATITPANNFTIPSTVSTLIYTKGRFASKNSSTFTGALYAGSLSNGAQVRVTHASLNDIGFNWDEANPQRFTVRNVSIQEVP